MLHGNVVTTKDRTLLYKVDNIRRGVRTTLLGERRGPVTESFIKVSNQQYHVYPNLEHFKRIYIGWTFVEVNEEDAFLEVL